MVNYHCASRSIPFPMAIKNSSLNIPGTINLSLIVKYCPYIYLRVTDSMIIEMIMIMQRVKL
jgi:hypothetical protein